jgi:uncharacterized protein
MSALRRCRSVLASALAALAIGGCGGEAEPSEPTPPVAVADRDDPFAAIPREQLYGATAAENLWSPRFELEVLDLPPGWHGVRIAILSDLQLGLWEENQEVAEAAVREALRQDPEVIVLLGDYLASGDDPGPLERVLAPLRGRRVLAVLGDRDIRSDTIQARVTRALEASGVQLLRNSSTAVELGGDTAWIAGLDPGLLRMTWADQQWVLATLGEPGRTPILLTHVPGLVTRAPDGRFPIMLAGHTFCGRVEVPGTPRLSWLRSEVLPNAGIAGIDRLFRVQGGTLLVTCGLGYGFVPIRFGAAPEVPILTVVRAGSRAAPEPRTIADDTLIQRFQGPPADTL